MKKLHYALLCFICILSACKTEPTEQAAKQMSEIRMRLKKAAALLPAKGQEKVINPKRGSLPQLFTLGEFSKKEELNILQINRPHLAAMLEKNTSVKDADDQGLTIFSASGWEMLDPDPFESNSETKYSHEKNVQDLYDKQYLRVTQVVSYTPGEIENKTIKKSAEYKVWFWLIDLKNNQLLGARQVEGKSGQFVFTMIEKGEKYDGNAALASNARGDVNKKIEGILKEWADKSFK